MEEKKKYWDYFIEISEEVARIIYKDTNVYGKYDNLEQEALIENEEDFDRFETFMIEKETENLFDQYKEKLENLRNAMEEFDGVRNEMRDKDKENFELVEGIENDVIKHIEGSYIPQINIDNILNFIVESNKILSNMNFEEKIIHKGETIYKIDSLSYDFLLDQLDVLGERHVIPKGKFCLYGDSAKYDTFGGINNITGDLWVEDFEKKEDMLDWLVGKESENS